jgi:hypothetical protein
MFDASASLLAEERRQQLSGTIPVLNVGWQDHHQKNQADRIDQAVSSAPVDLLACTVAPLVSELSMLWPSMIAALGWDVRPAAKCTCWRR